MNNFKDFGIKPPPQGFVGEKIKMDKVLNTEIEVVNYKIDDSKFDGTGKCLCLQIKYKETERVIFTGSKSLAEMIEVVPKDKFPFKATIVKENDRYEFT